MTLDEMKKHITEHIDAEIKDAEKYESLAASHPDYAGIFHDMAHDECCHAKMLRHVLEHAE